MTRRLRVLIINDNPVGVPGYFEVIYPGGAGPNERVFGHEASQRFWGNFQPGRPPDLVLVDINFEKDLTSPFPFGFPRPTGLLHALPFLAWSRVSSQPSVVSFHTGDPDLFVRDSVRMEIRALAIELAALARAVTEGGASPLLAPDGSGVDWSRIIAKLRDAELEPKATLARYFRATLPKQIRHTLNQKGGGSREELVPKMVVWANKLMEAGLDTNDDANWATFLKVSDADHPEAHEALHRLSIPTLPIEDAERARLVRQLLETAFADCFDPFFQVSTGGQDSQVLEWVRRRTAPDPTTALARGIADYRRQLVSRSCPAYQGTGRVIIDPTSWTEVCQLLDQVAQGDRDPSSLRSCGLEIVLSDGTRDRLSLSSLFGEVACFRSPDCMPNRGSDTESPWVLRQGRPQLHDFVRALSGWAEVYKEAREVVARFPETSQRHTGPSLNNTSIRQHQKVVRFVVVMFQIVRLHQMAWESWEGDYQSRPWDVTACGFSEDANLLALSDYVQVTARALTSLATVKGPTIPVVDIADELRCRGIAGATTTTVLPFLRILRSAGSLSMDESLRTVRATSRRFDPHMVPPCPPELSSHSVSYGDSRGGAVATLAASLGLDRKLLGRVVEYITQDSGFLESLYRTQRCPGWIRELFVLYATDVLQWDTETQWPEFMKKR